MILDLQRHGDEALALAICRDWFFVSFAASNCIVQISRTKPCHAVKLIDDHAFELLIVNNALYGLLRHSKRLFIYDISRCAVRQPFHFDDNVIPCWSYNPIRDYFYLRTAPKFLCAITTSGTVCMHKRLEMEPMCMTVGIPKQEMFVLSAFPHIITVFDCESLTESRILHVNQGCYSALLIRVYDERLFLLCAAHKRLMILDSESGLVLETLEFPTIVTFLDFIIYDEELFTMSLKKLHSIPSPKRSVRPLLSFFFLSPLAELVLHYTFAW